MSPSNKFCLKWNDFQENISSTFQGLLNGDDFADVTLACENDQFVESHKIVLSASSPFFMKILQKTKRNHPLIYLRGIKAKDLTHILEFMYHGQVNVYEEDLQHFLALAQELQLKGLGGMEKQGDTGHQVMINVNPCRTTMTEECGDKHEDQSLQIVNDLGIEDNSLRSQSVKIEGIVTENQSWEEDALDPTDFHVDPSFKVQLGDGGLEELDQQIATMMMKGEDNIWTCTVCGKKATKGRKPGMKNHIEAMHIESMPHPCDICGQTYK